MKRKALLLFATGVVFLAGYLCGPETAVRLVPRAVAASVVSCFDIETVKVHYSEPLEKPEGVCRLELLAPPGYEPVDKNGKRLGYHPYILIKKK